MPVRVPTIRKAQPKLPDVLNSLLYRTSVVPAVRLPRIAGIGAGSQLGSDRRNRGSRSGPKPIPARSAPVRVSDCRNDPQRAVAYRSESCAFRRGRVPNSFTGSFATCTNPSWARRQGLELFAGAWSCSRKGPGDSKHIQTMPVKPKMGESGPGSVPDPWAFGLAARRVHRRYRRAFKQRNDQTPGPHVRMGLNFRD